MYNQCLVRRILRIIQWNTMWILIKHKIFAYAGLESSKRQQRGCLLEVQAIKLGLLALAITWYWRICGAPQLPLMDCCCYTLIAKSRPAWYNSTQKLNQESWILQMIYQSPHNALAAHEFTPQMPCKAIPNQQLQALLKKKMAWALIPPKAVCINLIAAWSQTQILLLLRGCSNEKEGRG